MAPLPGAPSEQSKQGKSCAYAEIRPRKDKRRVLPSLVSRLAPDVDLDDEDAASPSALANFEAASNATGASPSPRHRSHDQLSRLITGGLPDQSTGDVLSRSPVAPILPAVHPPPAPHAPHPSSLSPLRTLPPPRLTNRTRTVATPSVAAPTEALEVQPRSALGYEWDERHQKSWKDHDGTASLSVEPDGEGYLGFASGATLLRILQIAAGGVSLSQIGPAIQTAHAAAPEQLSYSEQCRFLDGYFAHYHPQYPLVHEPTFRAQWNEVIARPPQSSWTLLSNVVIGLGAFCLSSPMSVIDHFLERAIGCISTDVTEAGSLTLVQAFCLLSNLTQKRNKPNSGSLYLGIAVRMAISLGLHRELPFWSISPFEREVRRRVWWVVFIFDSGASITFGRPILLPYAEADVDRPNNIPDRLFTPSATSVPPASTEPTIYSSLTYQANFHLLSNRIYSRVISSPPPSSSETLELDTELQTFFSDLPSWMTPFPEDGGPVRSTSLEFSAQKHFWRYCNLRIILHRRAFLERVLRGQPLCDAGPGVDPNSLIWHDVRCSQLCLESAGDSIRAIHRFFSGRWSNRLESWYGLHFLFHASFVPLIALHIDPGSSKSASWVETVHLARAVLEMLQEDPLAGRCLRIVDRLAPAYMQTASSAGTSTVAGIGLTSQTDPAMDGRFMNELLQGNSAWTGTSDDLLQTLLPFADLATLSSFWPSTDV
ncbi:hypothetical protein JCM24511_08983 [Saitozyma sp. JCM 24511]|nr:hypothetical protein JCM24511_08983 [Saitozyma sp. JCM 24511]